MALRRTGFKRRRYADIVAANDPDESIEPMLVRQAPKVAPIRVMKNPVNQPVVSIPKAEIIRSEAYRRLVANLPCKVCGVVGYSQAAHPNTGKGAGIKTDDRLCFALCCDRPGVRGCHSKFDQGALFAKPVRRSLEIDWASDTRRVITTAGVWPKDLPFLDW